MEYALSRPTASNCMLCDIGIPINQPFWWRNSGLLDKVRRNIRAGKLEGHHIR
jgi:hypothetical protein